ncbi:MAG: methyltransferase domain-containing protein [Candidatus Cloacimonetes bacterium]|nr:methyltransferase domain-containing protein [Candidatus Cloacimonadota bacterium]
MAVPIIYDWAKYFCNPHEGLGSSYERIILNELLLKTMNQYKVISALESPSFGFTGLSGINLVAMANNKCEISLEDHDNGRLALIQDTWNSLNLAVKTKLNVDYTKLDYPDNSFDMGFNFSALWFTSNLKMFLAEFCRVCSKAILICVPNQNGIGYKMQIKDYTPQKYPQLHPAHLNIHSIKHLMRQNNWKLESEDFIDCPPWFDIGMSKELFLKKLLHSAPDDTDEPTPSNVVSILPYYKDEDPLFREKMLRLAFVEKAAPQIFKKYWAHHYYMLFTPDNGDN